VGNFPTCLHLLPHGADRLVIDLGQLRELPVGLLRLRLQRLLDQAALLLAGQVAAVDVGADDVGVGIPFAGHERVPERGVHGEIAVHDGDADRHAGRFHRIQAIASVEQSQKWALIDRGPTQSGLRVRSS
jgi:hypothetical protein